MRDDDVRAGSEAAEAVWRGSAAQSPVISGAVDGCVLPAVDHYAVGIYLYVAGHVERVLIDCCLTRASGPDCKQQHGQRDEAYEGRRSFHFIKI